MKVTLNCFLALFVAAILTACGKNGDHPLQSTAQADQKPVSDHMTGITDEQVSARQLTGEELFIACQGCHTLQEGQPHLVGPNLYGFMGSPAATRPDYTYTEALQNAGLSWNRATLTGWIVAPEAMVPGTTMAYSNIIAPDELTSLIDHLVKETGGEPAKEKNP